MTFALSKSKVGYKYPRIIRYAALESNILATLDPEFNLLRVDKAKYELLAEEDKQILFKTHDYITHCFLDREGRMRLSN